MKMQNPLISVIVPIYNSEKYLNNCINSIINQTYENLELILINDGSTDSSSEICNKWAKTDSRIKVLHNENSGASSARNSGIDISTGDYIAFVDSDDYLDSDMYESMLNELINNNADAVRCGIVRESKSGFREVWGSEENNIIVVDNKKLLCDIGEANGILPVSTCNKLFSKNVIKNIRFNTTFKYAEDTLFNFLVAKNINRMVYNDIPRYHYINNSESVSHREFNESRFDEHRVMDIIIAEADNEVLPYCIKGDVMKSFRTIKEMCVSGNNKDNFKIIRNRIISHKKEILKSSLYSKSSKLKTVLLWIFPFVYRIIIGLYGKNRNNKYNQKTN